MRDLPLRNAGVGDPQRRLPAAVPSYFRSLDPGAFALAIVVLTSIGWLLVKLPEPTRFLADPDWSCQTTGAQQIAFDKHPFVDWRATYGPLTFYASYAFRSLFDGLLISDVILSILGFTLGFSLLYVNVKRLTGRAGIALLLFATSLLLMPRYYKYYVVLCPLLFLFVLYRYLENPTTRRLWLVGASVAFTGLYRPDFGVFTLVVGAVGIMLPSHETLWTGLRRALAFAGSIVVFASPWLLFLASRGQLDAYLWDSSVNAVFHAAGLALPIPEPSFEKPLLAPSNLVAYSFALWYSVPPLAAAVLAIRWRSLRKGYRDKIVVAILLSTLCLVQSMLRSDYGHLLQALSCSYVAMGFLLNEAYALARSRRQIRAAGAVLAGLCIVTLSISVGARFQRDPGRSNLVTSLRRLTDFYWARPAEFMRKTEKAYGKQTYVSLVKVIKKYTRPDERVIAFPFLTSLYVFSERPFGGRQSHIAPGYFSSAEDQERLIEAVETQGYPLIVEEVMGGYDTGPDRKARWFARTFFRYVERNYERLDDPMIPDGYAVWIQTEADDPALGASEGELEAEPR